MKLKFKVQPFQTSAVESVVDCFSGQVNTAGITYRIDPGVVKSKAGQIQSELFEMQGFKNADIRLTDAQLIENINTVQRMQNLPLSDKLVASAGCKINLDVEMETGTGKTYCYIKTIFEMNKRYGWTKFIVVVPSIAIREGGDATGDVTVSTIRRIQIRETIKAHFEKEKQLFAQGIKVLSLFFIDEVAKYRDYSQPDEKGDYARIFEEEYAQLKSEYLSELREANPQYFSLQVGCNIESRKSPFQQASDYKYDLVDKIKKDGQLIARDAVHHGNVKIPFHHGVVFPNINKHEWTKNSFDGINDADKIFFWDDLHPSSDICSDPSGKCFKDALEEKFAPQFKFSITSRELQHLKQLLFPTVKIELPERSNGQNYEERIERIKVLDHHQEALARKFDGGHRLIVGPSGSGKTLILAHKAAFLKQYNPKINNILFVCYNITLVNYIRRLLADKKVPLGENGVAVNHFYELCSEILGEEVAYEKEDSDYYNLVVQEAVSKVESFDKKYDAILIDEGQDFSTEMLKVVRNLLNPKTNNLTIAFDENQSIYRDQISWKEAGIQIERHVHKLSYGYRKKRGGVASSLLTDTGMA